MKIRAGFVSNSSSSSFIVIDINATPLEMENAFKDQYVELDGSDGESEFGWQQEKYNDFYSKFNFAFIQAYYVKEQHSEWMDMLNKVVKEHLGASEVVFNFTYNNYGLKDAYIDHQSASYEGDNIEMFNSEEHLKQFLFCERSYINNDNDNH